MQDADWPSDWVRGVLQLCVLSLVESDADTYGYAVARRLREAGLGVVKGGTLYPILNRLEQEGALSARWEAGAGGPGRKAYALTESGRSILVEQRARWQQFSERAKDVINSSEGIRQ